MREGGYIPAKRHPPCAKADTSRRSATCNARRRIHPAEAPPAMREGGSSRRSATALDRLKTRLYNGMHEQRSNRGCLDREPGLPSLDGLVLCSLSLRVRPDGDSSLDVHHPLPVRNVLAGFPASARYSCAWLRLDLRHDHVRQPPMVSSPDAGPPCVFSRRRLPPHGCPLIPLQVPPRPSSHFTLLSSFLSFPLL